MPIYEFKCRYCGRFREEFKRKPQRMKTSIKCACGRKMSRVFSNVNTDLVNNIRLSNTMGVNQRQIPQAMKLYPGSKYTPDGRLVINNRKEKLERMKQRGLVEYE